jgi:thiol:disulfide interchange protein DsbD
VLLAAGTVHAQVEGAPDAAEAHPVSVRLICDADSIGPHQTFHLAVRFDIRKKWHLYWKNPGEGALPPDIELTVPDGYTVGEILWPRPTAVTTSIGPEYCYFDTAVLFIPITAPASLPAGTATLRADVRWAACRKVCVLGRAQPEVTVNTSSRPVKSCEGPDLTLAAFRKRLPNPMVDLAGAAISFEANTLTLSGPAGGMTSAAFFPVDRPGITYETAAVKVENDRFRVVTRVGLTPHNAGGEPMVLAGLVTLGEKADDPSYDFELPLDIDLTRKAGALRDSTKP